MLTKSVKANICVNLYLELTIVLFTGMAVRCTQSTMISPDGYYTPFVMLGALCLGFVAPRSIYTFLLKIVGSWQECFVSTNTRRSEKMWTKLLLCSKPSHYWAKQEIRTTTLHEKPYKGAKKVNEYSGTFFAPGSYSRPAGFVTWF